MYFLSKKQQNWSFIKFNNSGMKCLNFLGRVMSKDELPTVKVSVCNVPISEIDSSFNSILRPADRYGVTTELKKSRVQLVMYF